MPRSVTLLFTILLLPSVLVAAVLVILPAALLCGQPYLQDIPRQAIQPVHVRLIRHNIRLVYEYIRLQLFCRSPQFPRLAARLYFQAVRCLPADAFSQPSGIKRRSGNRQFYFFQSHPP